MALRNLSVREMVQVTEAWITPGNPAHTAITSVARLAALLPDMQAAHRAIFAVAPREENPRAAEIAVLASEVDSVHDTLARGIYGLLTEVALLEDDAESLLRLRDTLMPEGLGTTIQDTYRGQAGYAKLLRERLTPDVRTALESLPLREGTLLTRVLAWLDAGDRLGHLEEERARLAEPEEASAGAQTVQARLGWIRAVKAFVAVADLSELDPEKHRTVFGPLEDAEATAERRAARRSAATTPQPTALNAAS